MKTRLEGLKIVPASYATYMAKGLAVYPLDKVNGQIVVVDPLLKGGVGYFNQHDFHMNYRFMTLARVDSFSEVQRRNEGQEIL